MKTKQGFIHMARSHEEAFRVVFWGLSISERAKNESLLSRKCKTDRSSAGAEGAHPPAASEGNPEKKGKKDLPLASGTAGELLAASKPLLVHWGLDAPSAWVSKETKAGRKAPQFLRKHACLPFLCEGHACKGAPANHLRCTVHIDIGKNGYACDSASDTLHAQPKASRSNAAPAGEGVLNPPRAGHASHATHACALSRSLEQTCKVAALLCLFFSSSPFVISWLLQQCHHSARRPQRRRTGDLIFLRAGHPSGRVKDDHHPKPKLCPTMRTRRNFQDSFDDYHSNSKRTSKEEACKRQRCTALYLAVL
jgi:hypothetical protein